MHSRRPRGPAEGAPEHGIRGALLGDLSSPSRARLSAHLSFTGAFVPSTRCPCGGPSPGTLGNWATWDLPRHSRAPRESQTHLH